MPTSKHIFTSLRISILLTLIISSFSVLHVGAVGKIIYVKQNPPGTNSGTSWTNAYTDLQSALSVASSGDEIWVASGIYKPTAGTDQTISFVLKQGVAVYGGFAGIETALSQRNHKTNITILSGDIGVPEDNSVNSFHVVTAEGINSETILDGFTIKDGNANNSYPYDSGGGLFSTNSSPILRNLTFIKNFAVYGGGLYNEDNSHPNLQNVTFMDNLAGSGGGGGMYNKNSNPTLVNVLFEGNAGLYSFGGGMYNEGSSPALTRVVFTNNSNSAMYNLDNSNPSLTNVSFIGNSSLKGGGMFNTLSNPSLLNVLFANNSVTSYSEGYGGGMNNESSSPSLTNVTFSGNTASHLGAGIFNIGGSNPSLTNVTFHGNSALTGSGIYNLNSSPVITNSIFWKNTNADIQNTLSSSPTVTYSIVEGEYYGGGVYPGEGNLNTDPLLYPLQDNGGFTQTLALGSDSSAIDAGDDTNCPANDQRGVARPLGSHCDIGAYESNGSIDITIGDSEKDSHFMIPGQSKRVDYQGVSQGPVKIVSTNNQSIIAAERLIYKVGGVNTSFTEMMALPDKQLDTTYWLPWYNNGKDLDTQLRIANVSGETATVRLYIGTQELTTCTPSPAMPYPYELGVGESMRVSCAGVNAGPLRIESTQDIVAAERLIYKVGGVAVSFTETMALPQKQVEQEYWLPWYNNNGKDLDTQLRIANTTQQNATVHIFIGENEMTPVEGMPLLAGQSTRISFPTTNNGPVRIVSDQPIVAAERLIYKANNLNTSFSEMMALPQGQLDTLYWLPWYNNNGRDLDTQLRFGVP